MNNTLFYGGPIITMTEPLYAQALLIRRGKIVYCGQLAQAGKAIIMISSDLPELMGICDRTYVMRDGCISGELPRSAFTQEAILDLAVS